MSDCDCPEGTSCCREEIFKFGLENMFSLSTFDKFDVNKDGLIELNDIKLTIPLFGADLKQIFKRIDKDKIGAIDFFQFCLLLAELRSMFDDIGNKIAEFEEKNSKVEVRALERMSKERYFSKHDKSFEKRQMQLIGGLGEHLNLLKIQRENAFKNLQCNLQRSKDENGKRVQHSRLDLTAMLLMDLDVDDNQQQQFGHEGTKKKKVNLVRKGLKKMIQEDPKILEQSLPVRPKAKEPKSEAEQDPHRCNCSHCSVLALPISKMTSAELRKLEKKRCWNCHATENLLKCAGCKKARYCSVECQAADRERHGGWCERRERLREVD